MALKQNTGGIQLLQKNNSETLVNSSELFQKLKLWMI